MELAKNVARKLVNNYSIGGGAFAMVPIPGVHSIGLTLAEAKLATDIARIYGVKPYGLVWKIILKALMLACGGSAFLKVVGEWLTFIPIIGWAAKSIVASSVVKGFGEAVILYFESKFPDQVAYKDPSWARMLYAFGGAVLLDDLSDYYKEHYGDPTPDTSEETA